MKDEVSMRAETLYVPRSEYMRRAIERMSNESLNQERKQRQYFIRLKDACL